MAEELASGERAIVEYLGFDFFDFVVVDEFIDEGLVLVGDILCFFNFLEFDFALSDKVYLVCLILYNKRVR